MEIHIKRINGEWPLSGAELAHSEAFRRRLRAKRSVIQNEPESLAEPSKALLSIGCYMNVHKKVLKRKKMMRREMKRRK